MVWILYIVLIAIVIYCAYAAGSDTPDAVADSLADVNAPTADQGRPLPVPFGTVLIKSANLVWYGDLSTIPIMSDEID